MDKNKNNGIGIFGILTIMFVVLKLCKLIDWSWFWVLSPTLIPIGIVLIVLLVLLSIAFIAAVLKN